MSERGIPITAILAMFGIIVLLLLANVHFVAVKEFNFHIASDLEDTVEAIENSRIHKFEFGGTNKFSGIQYKKGNVMN